MTDMRWEDEPLLAYAKQAIQSPDDAAAHNNLGVALRRLGRSAAAAASLERAVTLDPSNPVFHSNLGNALRDLGRLDDAERHQRLAIKASPDTVSYIYNLALVLSDRGRIEDAIALIEPLTEIETDNAEMAWDLALSQLTVGNYRQGFAGYEKRWSLGRVTPRQLPGPRWTGEPLEGRTLLLHSEQGFGDTLLFSRFIALAARQGGRIVLECERPLARLMAAIPGVTQVAVQGMTVSYDCWAPLASLPALLGVDTAEVLTYSTPYLRQTRKLATPFPRPPGARLMVGLVWAGKPSPSDRSCPLEAFLPLLHDPAAAFYSFQMGPRGADLAQTGIRHLVQDMSPLLQDFSHTAMLMAEMDVIITIDSAPAHVAGGLGLPAWVLLRSTPDWRWGVNGPSTPWYPTLRLFRQPKPGDFSTPVAEMAVALRQMLATSG